MLCSIFLVSRLVQCVRITTVIWLPFGLVEMSRSHGWFTLSSLFNIPWAVRSIIIAGTPSNSMILIHIIHIIAFETGRLCAWHAIYTSHLPSTVYLWANSIRISHTIHLNSCDKRIIENHWIEWHLSSWFFFGLVLFCCSFFFSIVLFLYSFHFTSLSFAHSFSFSFHIDTRTHDVRWLTLCSLILSTQIGMSYWQASDAVK